MTKNEPIFYLAVTALCSNFAFRSRTTKMLNPRKDERLSDLTIRNVTMRQILIEIEDEAYGKFMGMMELCPQIRVLDEYDIINTENVRDLCMRQAIMELIEDKVIRRPRDFGWIMLALEQKVVKDFEGFSSHQAFIDYLGLLGIKALPGKTTLFRTYNITDGTYPNWSFLDNPKHEEVLRRKNIIVRFLSAYMRAKRTMWNNQ